MSEVEAEKKPRVKIFEVIGESTWEEDHTIYGEDQLEEMVETFQQVFLDIAEPGDSLTIKVSDMDLAEYQLQMALGTALEDGSDAYDDIKSGKLSPSSYLKEFDDYNKKFRKDLLDEKIQIAIERVKAISSYKDLEQAVLDIFKIHEMPMYRHGEKWITSDESMNEWIEKLNTRRSAK